MKFDVALKHVKLGEEVGRLERTDRMFPCGICGARTGWRVDVGPDNPGSPLCSDECFDVREERSQQYAAEEAAAKTEQETLVQSG